MRLALTFFVTLVSASTVAQPYTDARQIIQAAIDNWRGISSYSEMTMIIHRPDWERTMSMRGWTRGAKESLVRVTAPAKDADNGTLILDNEMWTYSPKINRVIKVPSSMMGQSWMGSDFSNRDVARDDDILEQYDHTLIKTEQLDDHTIYHVEATPHPTAAVVWGRQVIMVRDDWVLLQEAFYDQDGVLVKKMETSEIKEMDGRMIAARQRMVKTEVPDEWTEIIMDAIDFDIDVSDRTFTLSNLRNPRQYSPQ